MRKETVHRIAPQLFGLRQAKREACGFCKFHGPPAGGRRSSGASPQQTVSAPTETACCPAPLAGGARLSSQMRPSARERRRGKHRGERHALRDVTPSAKAGATRKGFRRPGVILTKTRPGGASPAQKRAPPGKVFPVPKHFRQKPTRVALPQRKSGCHPKRFCLSRSIFDENPGGWSFPNAKAGNKSSARARLVVSTGSTTKTTIASTGGVLGCPQAVLGRVGRFGGARNHRFGSRGVVVSRADGTSDHNLQFFAKLPINVSAPQQVA